MPIVRFVFYQNVARDSKSKHVPIKSSLSSPADFRKYFFVGLVFYENCALGLERFHVFLYLVSYILSHIKLAHVSLKVHTCLISGVLYSFLFGF